MFGLIQVLHVLIFIALFFIHVSLNLVGTKIEFAVSYFWIGLYLAKRSKGSSKTEELSYAW
jgi:hypothetical protein